MTTMIRIDAKKVTGLDTLVGKTGGIRDFPKFMSAAAEAPDGSTVMFDWSGVDLATASYFGSAVLPIIRMTMMGDLDRYFVFVGLNQTALDELKLVLEFNGLVVLLGDVDRSGNVRNLRVLGKLESPYAETLKVVQEVESASASVLHKQQHRTGTRIGKTGWVNRLSHLYSLRLLKKHKVGRELVFETVQRGGRNGQ
jgi:hypothetical protein